MKQKGLSFEPEYLEDNGVKYEFSGRLYTPTPEEFERLERERKEQKMTILHDSVRTEHVQKRKKVRMSFLDAMGLRAK